jgi:hypothetical protein
VGSASVGRRAAVGAVKTTEYPVDLPGGDNYGVNVAPHIFAVWLDDEGRIRRASLTEVETGPVGHPGGVSFSMSITFSDFGVPVPVGAAGRVVEQPEIGVLPPTLRQNRSLLVRLLEL